MTHVSRLPLVLALLWALSAPTASAQIYVDADATGVNDGSSWADAYTDLQTAIDAAAAGSQIWIADGVYTPATAEDSLAFGGAKDGLELYGGFSGTESTLSARDPEANVTILSGDVGRDDADPDGDGVIDDHADVNGANAAHVLYLNGVDTGSGTITSATVIDGVTLTAGDASASDGGGGLYCDAGTFGTTSECSPTLRNVVFTGHRGGALVAQAETGTVNPTIVEAVFEGNDAAGGGGGIEVAINDGSGAPTIVNSVFADNESRGSVGGGAVALDVLGSGSTATSLLVNSVFNDNTAIRGGALANRVFGGSSSVELINTTLEGNSSSFGEGDGLFNEGSVTIQNTILWGNGGEEIRNDDGSITVGHTIVEGGVTGTKIENVNGGTVTDNGGTLDRDPLFTAPTAPPGPDGRWATADDGLNVSPASPAFGAGDATLLPGDGADLDGDGDTTEDLPLDLTGTAREQDGGLNVGAYEAAAPPSVSGVTDPVPYAGHPVLVTGRALAAGSVTYDGASVPGALISGDSLLARPPSSATDGASVSITTPGGSAASPATTFDRPAPYGPARALSFDGAASHHVDGRSVDLSGSALTMEAWIRPSQFTSGDADNVNTIAGVEGNGTALLRIGDAGLAQDKPQFVLDVGGSTEQLSAATGLQTGEWQHVAATYDGSEMRLYVDGRLDTTTAASGTIAANDVFRIGRSGGGRPFFGAMDQVRVWTTALSADQLRRRMHRTVATTDGAAGDRALAYRFDANGGAVAFDHAAALRYGRLDEGAFDPSPTRSVSGAPVGQESVLATDGAPGSVGPAGGTLAVSNVSAGDTVRVYGYGTLDGTRSDADAGEILPSGPRTGLTWGLQAADAPSATVSIDYSGVSASFIQSPSDSVVVIRRDGPGRPWRNASDWTHDPATSTVTTDGPVEEGEYALADGAIAPTVAGTTPTTAYPGHPVVLSGSGFSGVTDVRYDGTSVDYTVVGADTIRARLPDGAAAVGTAAFEVVTAGGSDTGPTVTVEPGPYGPEQALAFSSGPIGDPILEGEEGATEDGPGGDAPYVVMGADADALGLTNASFSVDVWFTVANLTQNRPLVGMDGTATNEVLDLSVTTGGRLRFGFGGENALETEAGRVETGTSYHAAVVYDAGSGTRTIYLNGVPVASDDAGTTFQGTDDVFIGRGGGAPFVGDIDQVRVWTDALTAAEVRSRMHRTVAPGAAAASEREVAYRFDASGAVAYDHSPNLRHGRRKNDPGERASGARLGQESVVTQGADVSVGPVGGAVSIADVGADDGTFIRAYRFGTPDGAPRTDDDPGERIPGPGTPERAGLTWGLSTTGSPSATVTIDYGGISTPTLDNPTLIRRDGPGAAWQKTAGWSHDPAAGTFTKSGTVEEGQYAVKEGPLASQIYVDADASGAADGSSWADAYPTLQDAINNASAANEIWIAEGVYYPDEGSSVTADDVNARFEISGSKDGLALYGGFDGTESTREARAPRTHRTVLSGDIQQDDATDAAGVTPDASDIAGSNSHHVIWLDGRLEGPLTERTVLDGLVVTAGQADGGFSDDFGGGVYCDGGTITCNPTLRNVVVAGNRAAANGGGFYARGVNSGEASPSIRNAVFVGNQAADGGGALYNRADLEGGAARTTLTNVVFANNDADNGGAIYNEAASPRLINVTAAANTASSDGGALYNLDGGRPSIVNTILWGNAAANGGSAIFNSSASATVDYSIVEGGGAGIANGTAFGDGTGNRNVDPAFAGGGALAGADGRLRTVDDSLNLTLGSPGLDAGTNDSVSVATDVTGAERIRDLDGSGTATVNLGAYERPAPGAPRLPATTVSAVAATRVEVTAAVTVRGRATTVTLQYGRDESFGVDSTTTASVPAGFDTTDVTLAADDLEPETTYNVRVRAQNSEGDTTGSVQVVTTTAIALTTRPDTARVRRSDATGIDVLANDEAAAGLDRSTVAVETAPRHGIARVADSSGRILYEHDGSEARTDSLTYVVADADGRSAAPTTVRLEIVDLRVRAAPASRNAPVPVTVDLVGAVEPEAVQLYARRGGTQTYRSVSAAVETSSGDTLSVQGTIPDSLVTTRGVDYYVVAAGARDTLTVPGDGVAQARRRPRHLPVSFETLSLPPARSFAPESYRMVSVPARPDAGVKEALAAQYGEYDRRAWRVLRWRPSAETYREYPALDSIAVGEAFWIITSAGEDFALGEGRSVDADTAYEQPLTPGWNQVGTPFGFSVPWDTVRAASGLTDASVSAPVAYRDGRYRPDQSELKTWEGYFVFSAEPDTLRIPPVGTGAETTEETTQAPSLVRRRRTSSPQHGGGAEAAEGSTDGRYTLSLTAGSADAPARAVLGLWPEAKEGRDRFDVAQPPPVTSGLRLAALEELADRTVPHLGSAKPPTTDGPAAGQHWRLRLSRPSTDADEGDARSVKLRLHEEGTLPEGYRRYLVDLDRETRIAPGAELSLEPGERRTLKVVVGTEAYAEAESEGVSLSSLETTLRPSYPNPFTEQATIEYVLGERQDVTIEIYNVLGQRVRTLVDGQKDVGVHRAAWDGHNRYGTPVGNGVYFYRLQAGEHTETRKMVLVR